jgi:hypothetical protein
MGSACTTLEGDRKWMQSFGLKTKGIEHLEDIDESIILKWLAKKCGRVPWKARNILTSRVSIGFSRRTYLSTEYHLQIYECWIYNICWKVHSSFSPKLIILK